MECVPYAKETWLYLTIFLTYCPQSSQAKAICTAYVVIVYVFCFSKPKSGKLCTKSLVVPTYLSMYVECVLSTYLF